MQMDINTVTITSEEYKSLIEENTTLRIELMRLKLEQSKELADYKNILNYFTEKPFERRCFEDWRESKEEEKNDE
jgi:hypothetical protein